MMGFIGKRIEKGWITKAMGRGIELGILSTLSALAIGLLDNVDIIIQGGSVDWSAFVISFATGLALSITAGLKKYARDIVPKDENSMI